MFDRAIVLLTSTSALDVRGVRIDTFLPGKDLHVSLQRHNFSSKSCGDRIMSAMYWNVMMKREAELVCKVDLHFKWSWPLGSDHKKKKMRSQAVSILTLKDSVRRSVERTQSETMTRLKWNEPVEVVWASNCITTLGQMDVLADFHIKSIRGMPWITQKERCTNELLLLALFHHDLLLGWLVVWLGGCKVGWLVDGLVGWCDGWLVWCWFGGKIGWLVGWVALLVAWCDGLLVWHWLEGWLVGCMDVCMD